MTVHIYDTAVKMGEAAAERVAQLIRETVADKGKCRILVSTGQSQFEYFEALVKLPVPWDKVEVFHLDEYIDLPITHPASFRKYLKERFIDKCPGAQMHYLDTEGDIDALVRDVTALITAEPIDIGIIGIGENGHIAFNDPPADMTTTASYHVVDLDTRCRMQQVGEGWFATVDDVPKQALSATVWQIMQCRYIISVVPHAVKAEAVKKTLGAPETTPLVPATKLRESENWELFLDTDSADKLIH